MQIQEELPLDPADVAICIGCGERVPTPTATPFGPLTYLCPECCEDFETHAK